MAVYLVIFLIVAIIIGLVALLILQRQPARAPRIPRRQPADNDSSALDQLRQNRFFWGAELFQPGCSESGKLLGKQFSFNDAPDLPLPGCSRETCACQFKGLRDRRVRARRINPDRRSELRFDRSHPDRRTLISRRRSDLWAHRTGT